MENESSKQIKRGAVISYFVIAFNMIAGLIYTPWMISQIGQENYGLYTLATSLITMFMVDFGMSAAVSRFLSKYIAEGHQEQADNFLGLVYKLYCFIDIIIAVILIILYFFIDTIYAQLSGQEIIVFKNLYLIVAVYSVITFPFVSLNGILTSYEKYVPLKLCELFYKVFIIVAVVIALALEGDIYALVLINAIAGIVVTIIKLFVIKSETPIRANLKFFDKKNLSEIFGFSIWTTIGSLAQRLIYNLTPSIIASVSSMGAVGVALFGLGSTIEGYVYSIASAISGLFMPKVSRLVFQQKDHDGVMKLAVKIGRIQCYVIGLVIVGFISVGKTFISEIWGKPDFLASYYCAILLMLPSYFYLPMEILNTALVVENKVKLQAFAFSIMGVVNVSCSLILSKQLGALGASFAIFISYMLRTAIMAIVYHKNMKFNMFYFVKETYLKITPILFFSVICGCLIEKYNPLSHTPLRFIVNGCAVVIITVMLIVKFVANSEEIQLFTKVLNKVKKVKVK